MTTITATVERIQHKSREFDAARLLLTMIALPFFLVGFLAYHGYRVASVICAWIWAAAVVGWEAASQPRERGP